MTFKDLDAARGCADANMLVRPLEGNHESDNNGTTTCVASSSKIIIRLVESQNEAQSSFVQFDVYMYRYHHYQPEHMASAGRIRIRPKSNVRQASHKILYADA